MVRGTAGWTYQISHTGDVSWTWRVSSQTRKHGSGCTYCIEPLQLHGAIRGPALSPNPHEISAALSHRTSQREIERVGREGRGEAAEHTKEHGGPPRPPPGAQPTGRPRCARYGGRWRTSTPPCNICIPARYTPRRARGPARHRSPCHAPRSRRSSQGGGRASAGYPRRSPRSKQCRHVDQVEAVIRRQIQMCRDERRQNTVKE
jgi:hypothetical protein